MKVINKIGLFLGYRKKTAKKQRTEEERLATMKYILTADWLPCDAPGCTLWFSAAYDFRGMEDMFALRKLLKEEKEVK